MTAETRVRGQPNLTTSDQQSKILTRRFVESESQDFTTPAVEFRNVHFSFDEEKVLDGVSFTVMRGEIKIILSGSGGGKSRILWP